MPISYLFSFLPTPLSAEIKRISASRKIKIGEIRLRCDGICTVGMGKSRLRLAYSPNRAAMDLLLEKITSGALYAHRDSIASGYISLPHGIRVGVIGRASYSGGGLIGVSDIRSLLFRIPTGECAFSGEIYSHYLSGIGSGMLIYSPPGVGKTTALRSLAKSVGSTRCVVVVDERCEFSPEDYLDTEVDILRGYKRSLGIEIATRTMSPELIMTDELSGEDGESLSQVVRCGLPIIATTHSSSIEELLSKPSLAPILASGAFDVAVGIRFENGKYILKRDSL